MVLDVWGMESATDLVQRLLVAVALAMASKAIVEKDGRGTEDEK
jgi:hypothetical protein